MAKQTRKSYLRTSDLARAAGVHVNTVRLYEQWDLIPPVERAPNGYRRFTPYHLDCMRLARMVFAPPYTGRVLRRSGVAIIQAAVDHDLGGALELAYRYRAQVQAEHAQADAAAALLERWAADAPVQILDKPLQTKDTARLLKVSVDMLRNWERNGLIRVPRNPDNCYRQYGVAEIERLRVIRMLSRAGYSTMAILRMLTQLDAGQREDLRAALDTPRPDEDVFAAADRWLSTLAEGEARAGEIITQLEGMIVKESK